MTVKTFLKLGLYTLLISLLTSRALCQNEFDSIPALEFLEEIDIQVNGPTDRLILPMNISDCGRMQSRCTLSESENILKCETEYKSDQIGMSGFDAAVFCKGSVLRIKGAVDLSNSTNSIRSGSDPNELLTFLVVDNGLVYLRGRGDFPASFAYETI